MTLRELRESKKLSQAEVAERCDCDQTTIGKLEQGKVPDPRHSTLSKLAGVYGVRLQVVVQALGESIAEAA